jgi:DHA2 family multidrug resistance protein-like MFS transporter
MGTASWVSMTFEHPTWLASAPSEGGELYRLRWLALVPITLSILLIGIDVSIVGVAVPSFTTELGATTADIQWIFDGFTIALGGFVVLGGGLADRFGRKGVFQIGMLVFGVGCVAAAMSTTPPGVVGGRIITGFGAALVMPPALSMLGVIFPPEERPRAIAIYAGVSAFGIAIGPVIGGVLLENHWFGSIFLVNVPITVVAVIGAAFVVPTSRRPGDVPLDVVAAVLSVFALGGLVAAIIEAPNRGVSDPWVVACFVVGMVATVTFVRRELASAAPLFDLRVLALRPVLAGALAMTVTYFTYCGTESLLIPQYLQYVAGYSSATTGLLLLPVGVVFGTTSLGSTRLIRRFGATRIYAVGLGSMTAGLAIFSLLSWWGGYGNVLVGIVVFFTGVGLVVAPATAQIMGALPPEKAGDGSATNQVSRQVGGALGTAVSGSIFALAYGMALNRAGTGLSPAELTAAGASVGAGLSVAESLPAAQQSAVQADAMHAAATGMSITFILATILCGIALFVGVKILRSSSTPASAVSPVPGS